MYRSIYIPRDTDTPIVSFGLRRDRRSVGLDIRPGGYSGSLPVLTLSAAWWPRHLWALAADVSVGGEERGAYATVQAIGLRLTVGLERLIPWDVVRAITAWGDRRHALNPRWWAHDLNPFSGHGREIGFRLDDDRVRARLWKGDMGTAFGPGGDHSDWPWRTHGWEWSWPWFDRLFGASHYEQEPGTWHDATLVMDDRPYPLRIRLYRCRWRRRWDLVSPFRGRWVYRAEVGIRRAMFDDPDFPCDHAESAPMYAGKGENSWDCGDDCTWSMTVAVRETPYTVADLVEQYRESVEKSRAKYGRGSS